MLQDMIYHIIVRTRSIILDDYVFQLREFCFGGRSVHFRDFGRKIFERLALFQGIDMTENLLSSVSICAFNSSQYSSKNLIIKNVTSLSDDAPKASIKWRRM